MRRSTPAALVVAAALSIVCLVGPAARAQTTFTFRGRGWGHGVGLSQWGARGLAEKERTASQIVKHYYSGTAVEKKTPPSTIRVGLLQERAEIWIEGDGPFDLYNSAGSKKATGGLDERWRIVPREDALDVYAPGGTKPKFSSSVPVTVGWESHGTLLELPQTGYSYKHGKIQVDINPVTGKTRAVLVVAFEQYLYGLGEMPSSWHTEALEAQAIAGRTYALEKIGRLGQNRSVCNCAVYASTADQAYVGVSHEVSRWVAAVDGTASLVVTYDGKPIQAYYSASSGGFTENNEMVFGGTALPYLRGKCDYGDYFNGANPHNNWTVTMDGTQVGGEMADGGRNVGPVLDISYPSPRGVSARLGPVVDADSGGVIVEGALGTEHLSGGTFRSILGLKSSLVHWHITGAIRLRYDALTCAPGLPKWNEATWRYLDGTSSGRFQSFSNGRLFASASGKVFWIKGPILIDYDARRARGEEVGFPTLDEVWVPGGRGARFERGNIYWSKATKAHLVRGAILTKYKATGGVPKWGLATTDEMAAGSGRTSRFKKCRIYWTSAHGAHVVYGAILAEYVEQGGGSGKLGLPISDEYAVTGGRRVDFEKGYIVWKKATGETSYKLT